MLNIDADQGFKAGVDYYLDKKTTIGVVFKGDFNPSTFNSQNTTYMEDGSENVDSITNTNGSVKTKWQNLGANLDFKAHLRWWREKELSGGPGLPGV